MKLPMNGPGSRDLGENEDVAAEPIDQDMEQIHSDCYQELTDHVQAMAESMGVSSASIMNPEVRAQVKSVV